MNIHIDASWFLLAALALIYFLGFIGFRATVVLMLAAGLPYGGPAR
ncbi:hypothetical protein [Halorubrum distributum]|nr:hypothetical protein [Halorubrum distributum]